MPEKIQCPNCLGDAEKTGDKIICVTCDATFKILRTGAAAVVKIGQVEALEARVKEIEDRISGRANLDPDPKENEEQEEQDIL
jgi:hypothetical protein